MNEQGVVYLVGAGPGDPELITLRGLALLEQADVVIHDRLIGVALLSWVKPGAEVIDAGKAPADHRMSQEQINECLVHHGRSGKRVVRLKGGDPYVFGRGWEELEACRRANVPCRVIPGVSSALAAPLAAGIPLTFRDVSRGFAVVTGQSRDATDASHLTDEALCGPDTVAVLMGRANLETLIRRFIQAGRAADTPAACIADATLPTQRVLRATLGTIAEAVEQNDIRAPMVLIVGEVAGLATADPTERALPLAGRRVVVTRPHSASQRLHRELLAAGASVVHCPMIEIRAADASAVQESAFEKLDAYDWLVFTSVHGVIGFWEQLRKYDRDARALAACRVAAIGPATAAALWDHGIRADVVAEQYTALGLVQVLTPFLTTAGARILYPHSNIARPELAAGLRDHGARVDEVVVYHTEKLAPTAGARRGLAEGFDAVLFYSPSAVESWADSGIAMGAAVVACVGPTTAQAARQAGLTVQVVAAEHSDAGLVTGLADHFNRKEPPA